MTAPDRQRVTFFSRAFEPETITAILAARRQGQSASSCAAAGGVHHRTLNGWVRRGRAGESLYAEFARAYDAASDVAIAIRVKNLRARVEQERLESEAILTPAARE